MEQQTDITQLLGLMVCPVFCVKDNAVVSANLEAVRLGVRTNEPITPLLSTGQREYADFEAGCLHLTVSLAGAIWGCCVTKVQDVDVFVLDHGPEQAQLQAMALAAQGLRSPLSNVMSLVDELFPVSAQSADPEAVALASRINRGLYQMLRIVGNMSDAYRYHHDNEPQSEYRDICSLWDEFWAHSAELVSNADITMTYNGLRESIICLVDWEKLERAAGNLLSNAIKFTAKGGTIDVRLARRGNILYLTVLNSGDTIPEELRGSIYSRYLRQPGIEDSRYGIGLGMVLVRSAAAMHGGAVLMEHLQKGTRVTMTMEIRQNSDNLVRSPALRVDYAGERDHKLIELSEILPNELYSK